jgi:hypothetical protein
MQHYAQELMQLHRTFGHLTNLVQAQAAREEAQWLGVMTWMRQREQNWDAHVKHDKLWGVGISNMITKVMN